VSLGSLAVLGFLWGPTALLAPEVLEGPEVLPGLVHLDFQDYLQVLYYPSRPGFHWVLVSLVALLILSPLGLQLVL